LLKTSIRNKKREYFKNNIKSSNNVNRTTWELVNSELNARKDRVL